MMIGLMRKTLPVGSPQALFSRVSFSAEGGFCKIGVKQEGQKKRPRAFLL